MVFKCYFCCERDREGYWSNWCSECANLRRMLLIYSPDKCTNILKRTLTRDETQINYKISQEVKKIVNKEIEDKVDKTEDESYESKPHTRSNAKRN
tara:strand:+ start:172 stop:459 length:288 start_codon:yes stop_codon:yes gene_type:complete